MTEPPAGIVGVFDRAADTYDAVGVDWFGPIARGLVDGLQPVPGERALDIGCGRGAALLPLARAVGPAGQALGVDLSPRMVQATAADLVGLPQVRVQVDDASNLAVTGPFDVIASSLVLFFLTDPGAAVRRWAGLLAPGGRLGVATFGPQDANWAAVDELFTPYLPPGMLDARTSGRRGPFASDAGVEALLADAELTKVHTAHLTVNPVFADPAHWLAFSWSHGQRAMWEAVPPDRRPEVERAAFDLLGGLGDADGRITFGQDIRYTFGRRPA